MQVKIIDKSKWGKEQTMFSYLCYRTFKDGSVKWIPINSRMEFNVGDTVDVMKRKADNVYFIPFKK